MSKRIDFKGVIKPLRWDEDFVIVTRTFAQDRSISPFTKAVILDIQSRSENWQTSCGAIVANYDVGRNKARSVLSEGQAAGYVYAHTQRTTKGLIEKTTYHISTCKRSIRAFVVENGWETEQSYDEKIQALKNQAPVQEPKNGALDGIQEPENRGLDIRGLVNRGLDLGGNERRERTKGEKERKTPLTPKGDECAPEEAPLKNTVTTAETASTVKSEVEPVTVGPRPRRNLKEMSGELQSQVLRNRKSQKGKNTRKTYPERFEQFWNAYCAAANGMHGTKQEAFIEWDRLPDDADQDAALSAISAHKRKLGDIKCKHACRYLKYRQFDDYAPQVRAAPEPVVTDDDKIRAVVWDIMSDLRQPDRIKRHGWTSFGAVKQAAPAIWAEALKRARADGWRPYGELVALAA